MSNSTESAKNKLMQRAKIEKPLIETDQAVVIKDAYPKAQYHFIVVSKEDIPSVCALTRDKLPLLDHMKELANQIIEQQQYVAPSNFLIGFKIDAFMNGLNMHVISNDFYSKCMRRVKHWNSFNTELFLTYQAVYAAISFQGSIEPMAAEKADKLLNALPLHCNQCDFKTDILLGLKGHLFEHWEKREHKLQINQEVEKIIRMLDDAKLTTLPKAALTPNRSKSNQAVKSGNHDPNLPANPFKSEKPATNRNPSNWRQNKNNQLTDINKGQHANHFDKNAQKSPYSQSESRQFNQGAFKSPHGPQNPSKWRQNKNNQLTEINKGEHANHFDKNAQKSPCSQSESRQLNQGAFNGRNGPRTFNGPNVQKPGLKSHAPNHHIGNMNTNMHPHHSQAQFQPRAKKSSAPKAQNKIQGNNLQESK